MGRYDDRDIFKKLNKEKPLVKQLETKSPGITVKRMDLSARAQDKKQPELWNTRSSYGGGSSAPKRSFKEFSVKPSAPRPKEPELRTDFPDMSREKTVRERRIERQPSIYTEPQEERRRPEPIIQQRQAMPEPFYERPQQRAATPEPEYERPQRQQRPVRPQRPVREEPTIYAEPRHLRQQEASGTYRAQGAHSAARYEFSTERQKKERKYRHELKYYINTRDYELLKSAISGLLLPDAHARGGGYHIRSLYFDDFENSAVKEKVAGVPVRKKYRIRIYNKDMSFIRLERKIKNGELVSKDSLPLTIDEYTAIIEGNFDFLLNKKSSLAHDLFVEMRTKGLRPAVVVDYYREAYEYGVEDVRITFDSDLRSGLFDKDILIDDMQTIPMYDKGLMVLEVKYNRYLPHFIKAILNNAEYASRSAISKYAICRKYE